MTGANLNHTVVYKASSKDNQILTSDYGMGLAAKFKRNPNRRGHIDDDDSDQAEAADFTRNSDAVAVLDYAPCHIVDDEDEDKQAADDLFERAKEDCD